MRLLLCKLWLLFDQIFDSPIYIFKTVLKVKMGCKSSKATSVAPGDSLLTNADEKVAELKEIRDKTTKQIEEVCHFFRMMLFLMYLLMF